MAKGKTFIYSRHIVRDCIRSSGNLETFERFTPNSNPGIFMDALVTS